jgi:hypothetical protein
MCGDDTVASLFQLSPPKIPSSAKAQLENLSPTSNRCTGGFLLRIAIDKLSIAVHLVLNSTSSPQFKMAASLPESTTNSLPFQQPVCQNCQTSTTPLWRRDEQGSVLCNACGLFLKLHGRARPISLKTDVIKSRNRVKANQTPKKKVSHIHNTQIQPLTPR